MWRNVAVLQKWREHSWESLIRYFITPSQKSNFDGPPSPGYWINCGNQNSNQYRSFQDCPAIKDRQRGIHRVPQDIFKDSMPLEVRPMYFGNVLLFLTNALLVAGKKALTSKWTRMDGHHSGHLQHGKDNSVCRSSFGAIYLALGKMDSLCNASQA